MEREGGRCIHITIIMAPRLVGYEIGFPRSLGLTGLPSPERGCMEGDVQNVFNVRLPHNGDGCMQPCFHDTTSWPSRLRPLRTASSPPSHKASGLGRRGSLSQLRGLASERSHLRLPRLPHSCRSSPSKRLRREGVRGDRRILLHLLRWTTFPAHSQRIPSTCIGN